jgi:serine/threonine protein kinase
MPIVSGERFGAFEVLERLGAGGMGEVYRARDTRLDRTVALKVIRPSELPGPERLERFKREARAISRVNHPHICALYDISEHNGEAFLVMEYIAGQTLAARLERGPLGIEEVLRYGVQIADGLDIAHRNGVVHRDLKPSNIMLTRGGVKLLDFGLAKLLETEREKGNATTMSLGLSEEGLILGSLPYMAPEQLESKAVDARTDLFALGAVLYEMTTGEAPFRGTTKASLIVAILSQEPTPPLTQQPLTPALFDRTIRRCLAKAPDERWQTAADLAAELKYILETLHDTQSAAAPVRDLTRSLWRAAFALALIVFTIWLVARIHWSERAPIVSSQRPIGEFGASYRQPTISPDGGFIAFADAGTPISQIWIKNLAQGDPIQITSGDVNASHPAWSPNSDQIVFERQGQGLWSVPPLGGSAHRLLEFGDNPQFSMDGERLVFENKGREIWTARADGSEARRVEGVPTLWYPGGLDPAFSPDATSIVFFVREVGPNGDLWIVPTIGGTPRQLTHDLTEGGGPIWTPDGRFIIFSSMRGGSRTLWRVRAAGGAPEPLTAGAGEDIEPALSHDGHTLLYTNVRHQSDLRALNPVTGAQRVIVERRRQTIFPRVSRDGSWVAFFGFGDVGDVQVFVTPVNGGTIQQVTRGKGYINTMPVWSPDGSLIYYYEQRPGASFRSIPVGGGTSREVRRWKWESQTHPEFDRDGSRIAYYRQAAPGEKPVVEQTIIEDMNSGNQRTTAIPLVAPHWSPDGRRIVGHTKERPPMVATCPVDGTACHRLTPGVMPVWSVDGSRIYFLRDTVTPALKELWSIALDGSDQQRLFDHMGPYRPIDVTFDVSPKGEIIWSEYIEGRHELWQVTLRP